MSSVIEIGVPYEDICRREERIAKTKRFEELDRVPVLPAIAYRYLLPLIGVRFSDYYGDPEIMLRSQILAQKWLMENIRTDAYSITGAWIGGWTDFENAFTAGSLGCDVIFPDDDIPWVSEGWVKTDADLQKLKDMDFIGSGLNGRQLEYRRRMMEIAERYPVRFQGGPVFYPGENPALTHTTDGPFGAAGDVMGQTDLFTALYERPDFAREVLRIVTDKLIQYLDFCWEEENLGERSLAWSDDLAAGLSPELYRDFVLPEELRIRKHFPGWNSFHMCGKTDHLLSYFTEDLQINEFQGFGYQVDLDNVAQTMGGKVVLVGNIDPMLIYRGPEEEIRESVRRCIENLAPCGGYIVQDGANIPPETPVSHINALMEAAEAYGRFH